MEDVEAYLDSCVNTKFENLKFNWNATCSLCSLACHTFQELLQHISRCHNDDIDEYPCVLHECAYFATTKETLARHVVRKHSLELESLQIYSHCAYCKQSYANFNDLNRHSCCRSIKWEPAKICYCVDCKREFSTYKRYIFHMQFHGDEVRPKVCLICDSEFTDTDELFEHVHYEHQSLANMPCKRCDRNFKDKLLYEAHLRSHTKPFKYECIFCQKRYNYKTLLNSHQEIYHSGELVQWQCDVCDKAYLQESKLKEHMKVHNFDTNIGIYYCVACGLIGHEEQQVMRHMEDVDDSPCFLSEIDQEIISCAYTCEYCCADFKSVQHLQNHRRSKLHADGMYKCNMCDFQFDQYKKLRCHIKTHPTYQKLSKAFPLPRQYLCDHANCVEAFPLWSLLYSHKRAHKTETKSALDLKCCFCDRQFEKKMSLAIHIARSHNNSNRQCVHCRRSFRDEPALKQHIENNHEKMVCQYCNKTLKNRRNMELHQRIVHSGEHKYFCKHCHKGYFNEYEKNNHEAKVHGSVTFQCTACEFQTKYLKSLHIHLDAHRHKLQHTCTLCGKSFGRSQVLLKHIKRHEANNEFQCSNRLPNGCSTVFGSASILQEHILNNHQDAAPPCKRSKTRNPSVLCANDENKYTKGLDYIELYDENRELMASPNNADDLDFDLHDGNEQLAVHTADEELVYCNEFEVVPENDDRVDECPMEKSLESSSTNVLHHIGVNNVEYVVDYSDTIEELHDCDEYASFELAERN